MVDRPADLPEDLRENAVLVELLARKWAKRYRAPGAVGEEDWQAYAPIICDALSVADNHHNALACPYCNPQGLKFQAATPPAPGRKAVAKRLYDILEGPVANQDALRQRRQWELCLTLADAAQADIGARALATVLKLHEDGTLSEGQCCAFLELDRISFRTLADEARNG